MRNLGRALALCVSAACLLATPPALAGEIAIGGFAHDTSFGVSGTPHEDGTADVELLYRTETFHFIYLLNPKVYAKVELNTSGLTDFYTLGVEWRRHLFHTPFYIDGGVGGTYHDGYNTYPDHFQAGQLPAPNASAAQIARYNYDLNIYNRRKALGSDFLFNPNVSIGYDLTRHVSVEAAWNHYSNAGLGGRNPGIDNFGGRLVYRFGAIRGTRF